MSWLRPHSPASRAAAIALLGALAVCLHVLVVGPMLQAYRDGNEQLAEAAARFQRFADIAASEDSVEEMARRLNVDDEAALFLPEGPPAVVTADLQARLKTLAGQHQVVVSSARAVPPRIEDGLLVQGLALEISGETPNLVGFVREIETEVPFLFVESARFRTGGLVAPVNPTQHVSLNGQLVVVGAAPVARGSGT